MGSAASLCVCLSVRHAPVLYQKTQAVNLISKSVVVMDSSIVFVRIDSSKTSSEKTFNGRESRKDAIFGTEVAIAPKWCTFELKLLLITNRQALSNVIEKLDDLERPLRSLLCKVQ